jgi:tetratricopeptide (TPR) repeat protein
MKNSLYFFFLNLFVVLMSCGSDSSVAEASSTTQGSGNPAIDALTAQIAKTPADPTLYAARAKIYYEAEGYDEAIADMAKALSMDSLNVDYHHALADVYLDYSQSRLALKTMERAAALYPERIPTLLKLSEFQYILKQHTQSMKTVDQILKIDPQLGDAYFMMGRNFREMEDEDRAIASFQKAVDLDPDLIDAWLMLGEIFSKRTNNLAVRFYDNALSLDSTYVAAYFGKARFLHNKGLLQDAIDEYEKVNRFDPQMVDAYYNAGLAYLEMDSVNRAYKKFNLAVNVEPTFYMAYYYRGITSEMKGDKAAAKNDFQQTLNLKSDFTRAKEALDKL